MFLRVLKLRLGWEACPARVLSLSSPDLSQSGLLRGTPLLPRGFVYRSYLLPYRQRTPHHFAHLIP